MKTTQEHIKGGKRFMKPLSHYINKQKVNRAVAAGAIALTLGGASMSTVIPFVGSTVAHAAELTETEAPAKVNVTINKLMYEEGTSAQIVNDGTTQELPDGVTRYDPATKGKVGYTGIGFKPKGELTQEAFDQIKKVLDDEFYKYASTEEEQNSNERYIAFVLNKMIEMGYIEDESEATITPEQFIDVIGQTTFNNLDAYDKDTEQGTLWFFYETTRPSTVKGSEAQASESVALYMPMTNIEGTGYLDTVQIYPKNQVQDLNISFTKQMPDLDTRKDNGEGGVTFDHRDLTPEELSKVYFDLFEGEPGEGTPLMGGLQPDPEGNLYMEGFKANTNYYLVEHKIEAPDEDPNDNKYDGGMVNAGNSNNDVHNKLIIQVDDLGNFIILTNGTTLTEDMDPTILGVPERQVYIGDQLYIANFEAPTVEKEIVGNPYAEVGSNVHFSAKLGIPTDFAPDFVKDWESTQGGEGMGWSREMIAPQSKAEVSYHDAPATSALNFQDGVNEVKVFAYKPGSQGETTWQTVTIGEPVLDKDGNQIYDYVGDEVRDYSANMTKIGDPIHDKDGNEVLDSKGEPILWMNPAKTYTAPDGTEINEYSEDVGAYGEIYSDAEGNDLYVDNNGVLTTLDEENPDYENTHLITSAYYYVTPFVDDDGTVQHIGSTGYNMRYYDSDHNEIKDADGNGIFKFSYSKEVQTEGSEGEEVELVAGTDYEYVADTEGENKGFTIKPLDPKWAGSTFRIEYDMALTKDAVVDEDNFNNFTLQFRNDPSEDFYEVTGKAPVTTLGAKFKKVDSGLLGTGVASQALAGAEFVVMSPEGKYYNGLKDNTGDGVEDVTWVDTIGEVTTGILTSGEDGTFEIAGLDAGNYILREVKAPEGYQLAKNTFAFEVAPGTYSDENLLNTINNDMKPVAPITGSIVTLMATVVVGGALAVFFLKQRNKEEKEA